MKDFLLDALSFIGGILLCILRFVLFIVGYLGAALAALAFTLWLFVFVISSLFDGGIKSAWSEMWIACLIIIGVFVLCAVLIVLSGIIPEGDDIDFGTRSTSVKSAAPQSPANVQTNLAMKQRNKEIRIADLWDIEIVKEVVLEVANYAVRLGERIDTSKEIDTASYPPPITTKMYMPPEAKRKLKEQIFEAHKAIIDQYGYFPSELGINIKAIPRVDEYRKNYWEFYILL